MEGPRPRPGPNKSAAHLHNCKAVRDPKPSIGEGNEDTYDHPKHNGGENKYAPITSSVAATALCTVVRDMCQTCGKLRRCRFDHLQAKCAVKQNMAAKPKAKYANVDLSKIEKQKEMTEPKEHPAEDEGGRHPRTDRRQVGSWMFKYGHSFHNRRSPMGETLLKFSSLLSPSHY